MLIDPNPSQQHSGFQDAVRQPQKEVTMPKARYKHTLHEKSEVDGGAIRCKHILVSRFFLVKSDP